MKKEIKILIVEDEALSALLLKKNLTLMGYEVCSPVATGEDAVESAEKERPDVILMDIRLPGNMNGIEAAREIGSHHEIPIIFMTGYADEEVIEKTRALEPVACLTKPIDMRDIDSAIGLACHKNGSSR